MLDLEDNAAMMDHDRSTSGLLEAFEQSFGLLS
jgi:hypothetical protein